MTNQIEYCLDCKYRPKGYDGLDVPNCFVIDHWDGSCKKFIVDFLTYLENSKKRNIEKVHDETQI